MNIKEKIVSFMSEEAYKPMLFGEIIKELNSSKDMKTEILKILNELEEEGQIVKTRNDRYGVPQKMNLIICTLQGSQKGFGFLIPDDKKIKDIFISPSGLSGAMNGDRVIVRPMKETSEFKSPEGTVIRIITRVNQEIIGTFQETKNFGFVLPDDKRISQDVFISRTYFNGAKDGEKVIAKITEWPGARKNPEGVIKQILGSSDDINTHILSALIRNGIRTEFSEDELMEAAAISQEISEEEINRRKDFRDYRIVTIDGADAKDLDDAVHIIKIDKNTFELGVHIADVTNYVKENSSIDIEAYKRGTSVYMPGSVIPMLPKELSNGVCSLNPNENKLTLSAIMKIDNTGKVINLEIFESIIKSSARMTYTDVSDILENND